MRGGEADPELRRIGPPGVRFTLATAVAIVVALDANSRSSFGVFLVD